jgi:hypothetical protein
MKGHDYGEICKKCGKKHIPALGMLNKHHSKESLEKMSISLKNAWKNMNLDTLQLLKLKQSKRMSGKNNPLYGRVTKGFSGHIQKEESKNKMKKAMIGRKASIETSKKISEKLTGIKRTEEDKKHYRISAIKRIERQKFNGEKLIPSIGKDETLILNGIEKVLNYKICRQYSVAGYFLDGYIPELNIAFEVDEKKHFDNNGKLLEKDVNRQKEIEKELSCQFVRIDCRGDLNSQH